MTPHNLLLVTLLIYFGFAPHSCGLDISKSFSGDHFEGTNGSNKQKIGILMTQRRSRKQHSNDNAAVTRINGFYTRSDQKIKRFNIGFIHTLSAGRWPRSKSMSDILDNCGNSLQKGMCIQSKACPLDKVLIARENECLRHTDSICCEVARSRMPTDLFSIY